MSFPRSTNGAVRVEFAALVLLVRKRARVWRGRLAMAVNGGVGHGGYLAFLRPCGGRVAGFCR